jgi:hypothetical protein
MHMPRDALSIAVLDQAMYGLKSRWARCGMLQIQQVIGIIWAR